MPPTPFAVLCALARRPGSLLTKDGLLDEVWGHQFVSESVLKSVITKLRTILEDEARQPRFIERSEGALEQLAEALRFADAHHERVYLSQLFLIEGAIADACGQSAAGTAAIGRAKALLQVMKQA